MICPNCHQPIREHGMHVMVTHKDKLNEYSCSPKAEHSEVLKGCPPSAPCSARPSAVERDKALISSAVPRDLAEPAVRRYLISEERILTVSNHISEDEPRAFTKKEAIETVKYFRDAFDDLWNRRAGERMDVATDLMRITTELLSLKQAGAPPSGERAVARNDELSEQPRENL